MRLPLLCTLACLAAPAAAQESALCAALPPRSVEALLLGCVDTERERSERGAETERERAERDGETERERAEREAAERGTETPRERAEREAAEHRASAPRIFTAEEAEAVGIRIPPGHRPARGECRLWFPDRPPGHQPPPGRCEGMEIPSGSVLIRG